MEIWKDIQGYEGCYQISNLGRIKSLKNPKEKILKNNKTSRGYLEARLSSNGKIRHFSIHRLVAENFISNTNNLPEVNHIDGNKLNNNMENLEWITRSKNNLHAYRTKLRKVTQKQREASRINIEIARTCRNHTKKEEVFIAK